MKIINAPKAKLLLLIILCAAMKLPLFAQTGPAGVGNSSSNKFWLDANALSSLTNGQPVGIFTDRSGNGWNANQSNAAKKPIFLTGIINGLPVLRFNRSTGGQWLDITSNGVGAAMNNSSTLFVVARTTSGGVNTDRGWWQGIVGAANGYSGILFYGYPTTTHAYIDNWVGSSAYDLVVTAPVTQGDWMIASRLVSEKSTGTILEGYAGGSYAGLRTSNLQVKNHSNLVRLGASQGTGTHAWLLNGDIAETMLFNYRLTEAQRIIVENYLASKYNLPISNDFYTGNSPQYVLDVQGIGTYDGTANDKHILAANSKGLMLTESNNSLNEPNEYLMAGHGDVTNGLTVDNLPMGADERWRRSWYLSKTGNIDVQLTFDFGDGAISPPSDFGEEASHYKLLYRSSLADEFVVLAFQASFQNGDQVAFQVANMGLESGYYTLGHSTSTVQWIGVVDTNWNEPNNWSANRVPESSDLVIINNCTVCPMLSTDVAVKHLQITDGGKIVIGTRTINVEGRTSLTACEIVSDHGKIGSDDFDELASCYFNGKVTLEKRRGMDNQCSGGNLFSDDVTFINNSPHLWLIGDTNSNTVAR